MKMEKSFEPQNAAICSFGQRLRALMDARGISSVQLAARSGISFRTLWSILHDKGNTRVSTIAKLAAALDVPPAEIFQHDAAAAAAPVLLVREGAAEYATVQPVKLTPGWPERFCKLLHDRAAIIDAAMSDYGLPFSQAIGPVIRAFEENEKKGREA
jgi:transcriptional regulator with XRE-family HTH domain